MKDEKTVSLEINIVDEMEQYLKDFFPDYKEKLAKIGRDAMFKEVVEMLSEVFKKQKK